MSEASPKAEQIERELEALGEAPPTEAELALVLEREPDDEPEVASVARLSELAEPLAFDDLSELEIQRAWRNVEQRVSPDHGGREAVATPAASKPGGGRTRGWLFAVAGLAAAAVLLVVILPQERGAQVHGPQQGPSAEEVAELGEQVRAALRLLEDGKTDTERAAALTADYERRLEEHGG